MREIHVTYGENIKIQEFRLHCLVNGIEDGVVYEDRIPYPLNRYAVWIGKTEPRSIRDEGDIINQIIKEQIKKRKAERAEI